MGWTSAGGPATEWVRMSFSSTGPLAFWSSLMAVVWDTPVSERPLMLTIWSPLNSLPLLEKKVMVGHDPHTADRHAHKHALTRLIPLDL